MPEKKIAKNTFEGGRNTDASDQLLPNNSFREMENMRIMSSGTMGVARAVYGNVLIDNILPAGENICIGKYKDEESGFIYYCNWNGNNYHTVYRLNTNANLVTSILQSITDTNGIDILRWSKLKNNRINHIDVVANNLMYFVDGLNKARKFNIAKALDKTNSGYGKIIFEEFITAYKQTSVYSPAVQYITDTTRNTNNLYGNLYKFTVRFHYDDNEESNWSDWSIVAKPLNQSYTGLDKISFNNNCLQVTVATGNKLVKKIEIAFQANTTNDGVENSIFFICAIIDKEELSISDNSTYVYNFYNDGSYIATDQNKINRNYSFLPRNPRCQSFVKSAMTYTNFDEGWEVVHTKISTTARYDQLYLPDDTQNKQSNAQLIVQHVSDDYHSGFHHTITKFTVGSEVKKGVKYFVFGDDANSHYRFSYVATGVDTPQTVASYIKSYLTGIGRSFLTPPIQNEGTGSDGSVFFEYGHLGEWHESETDWSGDVQQVSYISLTDNGLSLQIIPYGSTTNYAVVYVDDDGQESLACTNDFAVIRTLYVTEIGDYKLPVHIININHLPPIRAKYWKLVRSAQSHGIEILIQKVIEVDTDNTSDYLDLVVGSLFTYQKIHENTILQYEFQKGDRLRLIRNAETNVLYSGYFETEILSYKDVVQEDVTANITTHRSDLVHPDKGVDLSYIGKNILINGVERTIVAVVGDQYRVDSAIGYFGPDVDITFASYSYIDRRGIVRIKKIPGVTVMDNSIVELFKPQALNIDSSYRQYQDISQKFEISGWGTDERYHKGTIQNQTNSQPAIVEINKGDAYIRDREFPTNNVVKNAQVLVGKAVDVNYSDFYYSDLKDLGRIYPQDNGLGVVHFGSRTRYSGNYIEDTSVNGLNDFDNLDRADNNDSYGDILRTLFLTNRLYVFKPLKDAYLPVSHTLTTDNNGSVLQVQSDKLLNQIHYFSFEGGIGNNPESVFYKETSIYHACSPAGCFARLGGEGLEPISRLFSFDAEAKNILSIADKYDLTLIGDYYTKYNEAIWSLPQHEELIITTGFDEGVWQTYYAVNPDSTTYEVTQQPATGNVVYDTGLKTFVVTNTAIGDDYFLYRPHFSDGSYGAVKKQCITTVVKPERITGYRVKTSSSYCISRATGYRVRASTNYCVQNSVPLPDFDFLVLRYVWPTGSGVDLDTFTGFQGTGTAYDGDLSSRTNWVGYNQNPVPPAATGSSPLNRTIPQGSPPPPHPYLNWGTDNVGSNGVEAILLDIKQFNIENPTSSNPVNVKANAVWYNSKGTGDITVEITTYKGGDMSLVGTDFVNTGGVLVTDISLAVNVALQSTTSLISNSQNIAVVSYNKTTNTATLTLV